MTSGSQPCNSAIPQLRNSPLTRYFSIASLF